MDQSYGLAANAAVNAIPQRDSACALIDRRLDELQQRLGRLAHNMESLADRALGPVPAEVGRGQDPQAEPPALQRLSMRIDGLETLISGAERQMERLDQIA